MNSSRFTGNRSFRTQVILYHFGHFVPTFWSFQPSKKHFVPRLFRTHFGHFVPSSTGYVITFESQFVPKSFCTYFGHFVPLSFCKTYLSCEHLCVFVYFVSISLSSVFFKLKCVATYRGLVQSKYLMGSVVPWRH